MQFKDRDSEKFEKYYLDLRVMLAVAGIDGVLEILTAIAQDYGDGRSIDGSRLEPDTFWLHAAAQLDDARETIMEKL